MESLAYLYPIFIHLTRNSATHNSATHNSATIDPTTTIPNSQPSNDGVSGTLSQEPTPVYDLLEEQPLWSTLPLPKSILSQPGNLTPRILTPRMLAPRTCWLGSLGLMLAITTQTSPSLAQTAPLNYGTHGPEVAEVQSRLVELGFFYHCATGFFGPLTKSAVLAFQQAHGLEMDGVVGPRTQQLLFNETGFATVEAGARSQPEPVQQPPVQQPPVQQTVAQGTATAELQAQLQDWGYYQGAIDGVHGPQTDRALRHFQQDQGLVADGIAGERTMAALNGARASGYEPSSTFEREPIIDPNPQILLPPPPPPLS